MDNVTGRQLAAARAISGLNQKELADKANVSIPTIKRMEASDGAVGGYQNNILAVISALESAGITFDLEEGTGPGVRMKK